MKFLERMEITLYRQDVINEAYAFVCRRFNDMIEAGILRVEVKILGKQKIYNLGDRGQLLEAYLKLGVPNLVKEPTRAHDILYLADALQMKMREGDDPIDNSPGNFNNGGGILLERLNGCSTRLYNIAEKGIRMIKSNRNCTVDEFLRHYKNSTRFMLIPGCGQGSAKEFYEIIKPGKEWKVW